MEFDQPKYKMGIKTSRKLTPKQSLRIMLPGLGPFLSIVVENLTRYMAVSHPQGPKLPDGFSWKNQKVGVYLWRAEDAGYFFQTKVMEDFLDRKYPILHIAHSDNLVRTQKRNSVRVETDIPAELFPLKSIDSPAKPPKRRGGCAAACPTSRRGGRHPHRRQGARGPAHQDPVHPRRHDGRHDRRREGHHLRPEEESFAPAHAGDGSRDFHVRNRILMYVYNLFGERETVAAGKEPEPPKERAPEGIVLKATPSGGAALRRRVPPGSAPADPEPPGFVAAFRAFRPAQWLPRRARG